MRMLARHSRAPVDLVLRRDLVRVLKQGHPWVFADALRERPPAKAGALARLKDARGRPIALGFYDPDSPLAFRACTTRPKAVLDEAWAGERLRHALALRRSAIDPAWTNGYRLLNGEGDRLPGLVCDVYGDAAVIRLDGDAPAAFWDVRGVAAWVADELEIPTVYLRERSRDRPRGRALVGEVPAEASSFVENGLVFTADIVRGQKTGFFLDQRDNRQRIRDVASDRRVLNLFGYTGGFSVYAGAGGARHVTTVDVAPPAIEAAREHWHLNGLADDGHHAVAADAFAYLDTAGKQGKSWDLVIADPPSFAPSARAVEKAVRAYRRLIEASARVTATGGILAACSCSSHVPLDEFVSVCQQGIGAARRQALVLAIHGQPIDHPWPLPCPELRYLKFVLLRVD